MPEWTYEGSTGCYHWADIGFPIADKGEEQSPIDVETHDCEEVTLAKASLKFKRVPQCGCTIHNTGFTVRVDFNEKTPHIVLEGEEYGLIQFHFHSPSEHTVDHKHHDLELHLVHESMKTKGKLAVIGIFFKVDKSKPENAFLKQVFPDMPDEEGASLPLEHTIDLKGLDLQGAIWRYSGSLTTPPCSEGVKWTLVQQVHTMSQKQFDAYITLFPMNTNRPVQYRNSRSVRSHK